MKSIDEVLEILEKGNYMKEKKTKVETISTLENGNIVITDIYDSTPDLKTRTEEKNVEDGGKTVTRVDFIDFGHTHVKSQFIVPEVLEDLNMVLDKFIFTSEYDMIEGRLENSKMYLSKSYVKDGNVIATKDTNPIYGKCGKFTYQYTNEGVTYSIYRIYNNKTDDFCICIEKIEDETHTKFNIIRTSDNYKLTSNIYNDKYLDTYDVSSSYLKDLIHIHIINNMNFLYIFFGIDEDEWHRKGAYYIYDKFESIFKAFEGVLKTEIAKDKYETHKITVVTGNIGYEVVIKQSSQEIENAVTISNIIMEPDNDKTIVEQTKYVGISSDDIIKIRLILL